MFAFYLLRHPPNWFLALFLSLLTMELKHCLPQGVILVPSLVRTPAGSGKAGIWVPAEVQGVVWKSAAVPTGFQVIYLTMFFSNLA